MRIEKLLAALALLAAVIVLARFSWRQLRDADTVGPNIYMDDTIVYVSVSDPRVTLLRGVTARDAADGDVTDTLVVESLSGFVAPDTRAVTVAAFDGGGNVSKATRSLVYTDYRPAVFSLTDAMRFPVGATQQAILAAVGVTDAIDGDISDRVTFSAGSVINVDTAGDYRVTLEVSNSAGDTFTLPLTVTIYEPTAFNLAPKLYLTDYIVYTKAGEPVEPLDYLDHMTYRGVDYALTEDRGTFLVDTSEMTRDELTAFRAEEPALDVSLIGVMDMTNCNIPGVYEIQYSLADGDGNRGRVTLTVVVEG